MSVHAGEARQKPGDSLTDPIFCASTYSFESTAAVIEYNEKKLPREEYGRYGNPNEKTAEKKLAALEGAEEEPDELVVDRDERDERELLDVDVERLVLDRKADLDE